MYTKIPIDVLKIILKYNNEIFSHKKYIHNEIIQINNLYNIVNEYRANKKNNFYLYIPPCFYKRYFAFKKNNYIVGCFSNIKDYKITSDPRDLYLHDKFVCKFCHKKISNQYYISGKHFKIHKLNII